MADTQAWSASDECPIVKMPSVPSRAAVESVEPLLSKIREERRNLVCDESGMSCRNVCALYVFFLESDTERVDAFKSANSIFEGMIHHADQRNFVVQDASNVFERRLTLVVASPGGSALVRQAIELPISVLHQPERVLSINAVGTREAIERS
jgi:hypothetical protein